MTSIVENTSVQEILPDPSSEQAENKKESGNPRLARNVIFNWAGYFVFFISGFILPRLISEQVGQVSLGIWDFGWSMVAYCAFGTAGVRSAVSTYVARYSASDNWDSLNNIVNSCLAIFLTTMTIAFGAMLIVIKFLPNWFAGSFEGEMTIAQVTLSVLTFGALVEMPMGVFNGVLTGKQRYDLVNMIEGSTHIAHVLISIVLLLLKLPIYWMAVTVVLGQLATAVLKYVFARREVPQLRISARHIHWSTVRFAFGFGMKDILEFSSRIFMHQTHNILIAYFFGAPMLAVFARPMALIQSANRFIMRLAAVFEPASSEAYAHRDYDELRDLLVKGTRYSLFLTFPVVVLLTLFGGTLIEFWMGPEYRKAWLVAVLAIGNLGFLSQRATYHVLLGMAMHGRAAAAMLVGAGASVVLGIVALTYFNANLISFAVAIVVPFSIVNLVFLPIFGSRAVRIRYRDFIWRTLPVPILAVVPFTIILVITAMIWGTMLNFTVFAGLAVSAVVLAVNYWIVAVPLPIKRRVAGIIRLTHLDYLMK